MALTQELAEFTRQLQARTGPAYEVYKDAQAAVARGCQVTGEPALPLMFDPKLTKFIAFLRWRYGVELATDAMARAARDGILNEVLLYFLRGSNNGT